MKAVIMAGGEGSRLRPLTCDLPKPMAPLCGRPILEYILDLLRKHGCDEAAMTLMYLPQCIMGHFPDKRYKDVSLRFVLENTPLGTAGSVKNAARGAREDFLVISGDALCDFDLTAAFEAHRKNHADITVIVKKVADPREYGLVRTGKNGRIEGFVEKPSYAQAVTNLANTGIYIISPDCLPLIPDEGQFDFAKDLFPLMLEKRMRLFAFEDAGYWCDIGDLTTYVSCQRDMLEGRVQCRVHGRRDENGSVFAGGRPSSGVKISPPVYIGSDVTFDGEATIAAGSVVCEGCTIGNGAKVRGSIVLQDSYIGANTTLSGAVVCTGGSVKAGAGLFEGSVAGSKSVIGAGAVLSPGVKIWPLKQIEDFAVARDNLQYGIARSNVFDDDGIAGETGVELTPEFCARVGAAVGSIQNCTRVAIATNGSRAGFALGEALKAGILSTGCQVWDFGEQFEAQFDYCAALASAPLGVYVEGGQRSSLRLVGEGGLPAPRSVERSIEGSLARGEYRRSRWDTLGECVDMAGMRMLYECDLLKCAPQGLEGMHACVRSENTKIAAVANAVLARLGCDLSCGTRFSIDQSGRRLTAFSEVDGYVWHERLLALGCISEFERGRSVALPYDAPRMLDRLAAQFGCASCRYFECPADASDAKARELAKTQPFVRDALMLALKLLDYLARSGQTLQQALQSTPEFAVTQKEYAYAGDVGALMRALGSHAAQKEMGEGVLLPDKDKRGVVLVRPLKRGAGIRVYAEASNTEIAQELCAQIEDTLS